MKKILVVFAVLALTLGVCGCNSYYNYANAAEYAVGGTEVRGVRSLEVDWIAGSVEVRGYDGNTVKVSESSNKKLSEDTQLRHYLDEGTLRIRYAASGKNVRGLVKNLTVLVPYTVELFDCDVEAASASVKVVDLLCRDLDVETASGNITLQSARVRRELSLESVSGKIGGGLSEGCNTLSLNTVSGNVDLSLPALSRFEVESVSGDVVIRSNALPSGGEAETRSGDFTLYLPEDSLCSLKFESVSGESASDFPDAEGYGSTFTVETTSGNAYLKSSGRS